MNMDTKQGIVWQVARSLARQVGHKKSAKDPVIYPTLIEVLKMLKDDPTPQFMQDLKDIRIDVNRCMSQLNIR